MGKPAARISDMHMCPMVTPGVPPIPHVGGPILPPGVPTVLIGGLPAATMSSMATCVGPPDSIILGSMGVFIGKKPAARMGDTCAHGGTIMMGCFTVLIGEAGGGGGGGGASSSGAAATSNIDLKYDSRNGGTGSTGGAAAATGGGLGNLPKEVLVSVMNDMPPPLAKVMAQIITMKTAAENGTPFCEKCSETKGKTQG